LRSSGGIKLAAGILGALGSASAGVSAVVASRNVIYQLRESRPWWKQKLTIVSLTLIPAGLLIMAMALVLYGGKIGHTVAAQVGLDEVFVIAWKALEWPVSLAAMFIAFSILYYFALDAEERHWFWVRRAASRE
jgi:membrane protein